MRRSKCVWLQSKQGEGFQELIKIYRAEDNSAYNSAIAGTQRKTT